MDPEVRIRPARLPADREAMLRVLEGANMHRIPSPEMHDFDVGTWYVGTRMPGREASGALRTLRMDRMAAAGAKRVITNADRPETIAWYERHFGYRKVGELAKLHEFGLPDVDRWTTLEAPLAPPGGPDNALPSPER